MKKIIFLGFLGLLLSGCQVEEAPELPQNNLVTTNAMVDLIELCHWDNITQSFEVIALPQRAIQPHLNHGDALLDADGDGYTAVGSCTGSMDDCDDNDPNIYPGNGCNAVLAIAYSNLNGEAGFQEGSTDVLISKLIDYNNDGILSAGDKVITNKYPLNLEASSFADFRLREHTITQIYIATNSLISVETSNGLNFRYLIREGAELYGEYDNNNLKVASFFDNTSLEGDSDSILVELDSPSQPELSTYMFKNQPNDNSFLDIVINL